jgi:hypothetical protein
MRRNQGKKEAEDCGIHTIKNIHYTWHINNYNLVPQPAVDENRTFNHLYLTYIQGVFPQQIR